MAARLYSPATNLFLLVLLALSFGCGGGDEGPPTAPAPNPTPVPSPPPPPPPPPEPVAPDTPQNLRVLSITRTSIVWTWDPVPDADGYEVEVLNQLFALVGESEGTEPRATASDLSSDTTLFLRARAFVGEGNVRLRSDWTLPVRGTTEPPPEPDPTWEVFGAGVDIVAIPDRVRFLEITADATKVGFENFVVWCGLDSSNERGGLFVNEILGTRSDTGTRWRSVHVNERDYNGRGNPCGYLSIDAVGINYAIRQLASPVERSPVSSESDDVLSVLEKQSERERLRN